GCVGARPEEVRPDGIVKEEGILRNVADLAPPGAKAIGAEHFVIHQDGSACRNEKADHEVGKSALPRARWTYHRGELSRWHPDVQFLNRLEGPRTVVAEAHLQEPNPFLQRRNG